MLLTSLNQYMNYENLKIKAREPLYVKLKLFQLDLICTDCFVCVCVKMFKCWGRG